MKVYYHGRSTSHRLHIQPGVDHPEKKEWHHIEFLNDKEVKRPKMFEVEFKNGVADVDDRLGEYMIEKGVAAKSPIITEAA